MHRFPLRKASIQLEGRFLKSRFFIQAIAWVYCLQLNYPQSSPIIDFNRWQIFTIVCNRSASCHNFIHPNPVPLSLLPSTASFRRFLFNLPHYFAFFRFCISDPRFQQTSLEKGIQASLTISLNSKMQNSYSPRSAACRDNSCKTIVIVDNGN